jgi:hypothetical protein
MIRQPNVVGDGTTGRCGEISGETCAVGGERRRSQSLHGTVATIRCEKRGEQNRAEGREAGRWMREFHHQTEQKRSGGSARKG